MRTNHVLLLICVLFLLFFSSVVVVAEEFKPEAREAFDKGMLAVEQKEWLVAIDYFEKAQQIDNSAEQITFNLGLAESELPGRGLRAYLAKAPNTANAEAGRKEIAGLEIRGEATIDKLINQTMQLVAQADEVSGWRGGHYGEIAIAQARAGDIVGVKQIAAKAKDANEATEAGLAAARQQQWLVAVRYFLKAQEATPTAPETLFNLALAESKIPGRELRALAWYHAYLLAAPGASNSEKVRKEMVNLKVGVEVLMENLFSKLKTMNDLADGEYWETIAHVQAVRGDIVGAKQSLGKAGKNPNDYETYIWGFLHDVYRPFAAHVGGWGRARPEWPVQDPSDNKGRLLLLIQVIKEGMDDEVFTDPKSAIQTILNKPNPDTRILRTQDVIFFGTSQAIRKLSEYLQRIEQLGR